MKNKLIELTDSKAVSVAVAYITKVTMEKGANPIATNSEP